MQKFNNKRNGCKDVFNSFLVSDAEYKGTFEFPIINPISVVPEKLIPFSKCISSTEYDAFVHFYEDDNLFERIWRNPKRYIPILRKFKGVILCDFSVYRDMPLVMQLWNIFRSRAIGNGLQRDGQVVIPNIRFGDKRTYSICCDGIAQHSVIAIGTHGTLKNKNDREEFVKGLKVVVQRLKPSVIVVYGKAPDEIFDPYRKKGIIIVPFESQFAISHKEVG